MEDHKQCLNCDSHLEESAVYCPKCGQKVDENNLKLKTLVIEFYENYLSFDTRLGRTIIPFLFKPGQLTLEFIQGKRRNFANPFRFYLVISILFFFLLGSILNKTSEQSGTGVIQVQEDAKNDFFEGIADGLKDVEKAKGKDSLQLKDSSVAVIDSTQIIDTSGVISGLAIGTTDSLSVIDSTESIASTDSADSLLVIDSLNTDTVKKKKTSINWTSESKGIQLNMSELGMIKKYRFDPSYTDEQLLDSIKTDSIGQGLQFFSLQAIRLYRADSKLVMKFIIGNYSLSMFILMPSFALLFMFFFRRNKQPFVAHLIHSLHLHTFTFFIYSLAFAVIIQFTDGEGARKICLFIAFIISAVYIYFSSKKVYARTHFSSILRVVAVGFFYYIVWAIVMVLGLIVSFLLF